VGDQVLAIGNPFGVGQTVTSGIVSALGRNQLGINTFENFIQTDAPINPATRRAHWLIVNGQLMGINTAIYSRSGSNQASASPIPVSTAKLVLEGIVKDGVVRPRLDRRRAGRPVALNSWRRSAQGPKRGVLITGVLQTAGGTGRHPVPGDVIVEVTGKQIANVSEAAFERRRAQAGAPCKIQRLAPRGQPGSDGHAGPAAQAASSRRRAAALTPSGLAASPSSSGALVCLMKICAAQMPTSYSRHIGTPAPAATRRPAA
jgi:S1-C subfamily serine protease